jgi:hypothetical protein
MLFSDSRWQCSAWLVNMTVVALYSLFPYFWCSTVDSIQFHAACCTAVSCRWRYITDISLVRLLPWSGPKCLPDNTHRICVRERLPLHSDRWSTLICVMMCLTLWPIYAHNQNQVAMQKRMFGLQSWFGWCDCAVLLFFICLDRKSVV